MKILLTDSKEEDGEQVKFVVAMEAYDYPIYAS